MKYESPMGIPDDIARLVGIIAAHMEWIELLLERAIAEIQEHDFYRIALLTNEVSLSSECDLILGYARVFEDKHQDIWKQFTGAIKQIRDAYSRRNEFVHAQWKRDKDTQKWGRAIVRIKGGKFTLSDEEIDIKELEAAANQIWNAGENFVKVLQDRGILTHIQ
ncbi:hypothetical protein [Rhodoplanes sp. Z2-YC6860]|uniref:hypothetical protein n=1 Tax=Rhodoplanes sp. Z2-YC6860 TaxID=674703 RepID=UPI0012EEC585|nr:hypothetical protein [Rhodoplanes sp. Z2-YC6860]